ncbi:hypothetical protein KSC_006400 [Ktedonobacter sp. SOSP1-52]|nr:hypothetical protein KSC_006400 [Ktedonobacter sp. SOSP1-52]
MRYACAGVFTIFSYWLHEAIAKSGLNKRIGDVGWSRFIAMYEYKATIQGIKVGSRMISQIGSGCGTVIKKKLSER